MFLLKTSSWKLILYFCLCLQPIMNCCCAAWIYDRAFWETSPSKGSEWTDYVSPQRSSFSLYVQTLARWICLCPPFYEPWWIRKRVWLMVRVFLFLWVCLFFLFTISKVAKLRAGEMNSVKFNHGNWRFGGVKPWPHGPFGDCFRLINVRTERVRLWRTITYVTAGHGRRHLQ